MRPRRLGVFVLLLALLGLGWWGVHRQMPSWYARLFYPLRYEAVITREAARYALEPALVAAVIKQESDWIPDSRSRRGAVGLMQLLPSTARFIAEQPNRPSPAPDDLEEPSINIAYGSWYLRYLTDRYDGTLGALVAYNAGEENLRRWRSDARTAGRPFRIPQDVPFAETRAFVRGVENSLRIYRRAYRDELTAISGAPSRANLG